MGKRWAVACAVAMVVAMGAVIPTAGAIPKSGETWTCDGQEVFIAEAGRNGWVDGVHYQAVYIEFVGVFTPEGGATRCLSPSRSSTATAATSLTSRRSAATFISRTSPGEGTFVGGGHVIAIPVN